MTPLSDKASKDKLQKYKEVANISRKMRNLDLGKSIHHGMHQAVKTYRIVKRWSDFTKAKLQGATVDFAKDMGDMQTFHEFKPHPDDQKKIDERKRKEADFQAKKMNVLRRHRPAKASV